MNHEVLFDHFKAIVDRISAAWNLQPLDDAPEGTVLYVWARGGRVQFCLPLDRSQLFVRRMQVKDYIEPAGWIPMPEIEVPDADA